MRVMGCVRVIDDDDDDDCAVMRLFDEDDISSAWDSIEANSMSVVLDGEVADEDTKGTMPSLPRLSRRPDDCGKPNGEAFSGNIDAMEDEEDDKVEDADTEEEKKLVMLDRVEAIFGDGGERNCMLGVCCSCIDCF